MWSMRQLRQNILLHFFVLNLLCLFLSVSEVTPGISRWLLCVIERGYTLQFRHRPPSFNGMVQCLALPQNAPVLRQEVCSLLEKGAIEKIPPSELESGFYSHYFVVPKKDEGLRLILDLRPINWVSIQDDNAETDPGTNLPRGLVCICGFKGHVLSHAFSLHD